MDYFEFFRFREDPFGVTPDPDFFYPSKSHLEALDSMHYFVKKGESIMMITGGPGTGKTTLIKRFLQSLDLPVFPVILYHSTLNPKELIKTVIKALISSEIVIDEKIERLIDKVDLMEQLLQELHLRAQNGQRVFVIIDEAQDLPDETLTEIKHLSNLETDKEKLLHFILLCQPYFEEILLKPENAQLSQRVSLRVRLTPLDKDEVENYIKFRIQRATESSPVFFESSALKKIYKASKGIPRLINLICSRALMAGYIENSYKIKKSYVKAAIKHLNL